jgi:hypothetical protein
MAGGAHWSDLIGAVTQLSPGDGGLARSHERWGESEVMGSYKGCCGYSSQDVKLQDDPQRLISRPNELESTRNQNQKKAFAEFYNLRFSCIYLWCVASCAFSCEVLETVSISKWTRIEAHHSSLSSLG